MPCWIAFIASLAGSAGLLAPAVGPTPAHANASLTPDQLLARFERLPGLQAQYREEKRMALLAEPLVSEGTIHYARPGRLARHQSSPERVSVVIEGDHLRFGGAYGQESVDLNRNPVIRSFVDSFVDVLAGDRVALEKNYRLRFQDLGQDRWSLKLEPKRSPIDQMIQGITMTGKGVVLEFMEILEIGGDSTRMAFSKVNARRVYSRRELRAVFRIRK